jgi:hypothetical protein
MLSLSRIPTLNWKMIVQRFYDKVYRDKCGCWTWIGARSRGYGQLRFMGRTRPAHVVSYILHVGEVPPEKEVAHRCDNGYCVNPEHLFVCTHAENIEDKVLKGRQAKGEQNGNSKLSEDIVRQIRKLCEQEASNTKVGRLYNVDQKTVYNIRHRLQWKYLND